MGVAVDIDTAHHFQKQPQRLLLKEQLRHLHAQGAREKDKEQNRVVKHRGVVANDDRGTFDMPALHRLVLIFNFGAEGDFLRKPSRCLDKGIKKFCQHICHPQPAERRPLDYIFS